MQLNLLDTDACIFWRQVGVETNDLHFEPLRPVCYNRTNIATANDATPCR